MGFRPVLLVVSTLGFSSCASADYGYAYCYDPYRGPVGYHTGLLDPKPACARSATQAATFVTHEGGGYREPYVSGPHPSPVAPNPAGAR